MRTSFSHYRYATTLIASLALTTGALPREHDSFAIPRSAVN